MKSKRNGFVLIIVLVIMATMAIVLAVVTKEIVAQRNLLRTRQRQLQAEWLARAGIELAAARLLESPKEFSEENRELIPEGTVKIDVKKAADGTFAVSAEAEFGLPLEKPVIRTAAARFRRTDSAGVTRLELVRQGR